MNLWLSRTTHTVRALAAAIAGSAGLVGGGAALGQPANPPPNDLCANAQDVTAPGPLIGTTNWSTGQNLTPQPCGFNDPFDVWYRVPPAPLSRQFTIIATMNDIGDSTPTPIVSVHDGCPESGAALLACSSFVVNVLVPAGQPAYIRLAGDHELTNQGDFVLDVQWTDIAPQPGDLCSNPLTIAPGSPVTGAFAGLSGTDMSSCAGSTIDAEDLWFTLTVGPGQSGTYVISTAGSQIDTVLSVFSACPTFNGDNEIACDDDVRPYMDVLGRPVDLTSEIGVPLNEGAYLIRLSAYPFQSGTFTLSVSPRLESLPGDFCTKALPLIPNIEVSGSTAALTGFDPNLFCGLSDGLNDRTDVWYQFTPTAIGVYNLEVNVDSGALFPVVRLFDTCNGTQFRCRFGNTTLNPQAASLAWVLNPGETYYYRIAGINGLTGAYRATLRPAATNDLCSKAIEIPTVQAQPFLGSISGTIDNSYMIPSLGDVSPHSNGVWYAFTPPTSGWYRFSTSGSALTDTSLVVTNSCQASSGANVIASNLDIASSGNSIDRWSRVDVNLTSGQEYFIEVSGSPASPSSSNFTLTVTQTAAPDTVPNDTCPSATPITNGSTLTQDARASSPDQNIPNCFYTGYPINPLAPPETTSFGVWYTFVADAGGAATFTQSGTTATIIRVLTSPSGSCNDLAAALAQGGDAYACGTSSVTWTVVAGTRYYMHVHTPPGLMSLNSGTYGVQPASPYIVSLSAPTCIADFNASGAITVQDIFDFLTAYFTNTITADVNQSGTLTVQDIFDFLTRYFQGC